MRISMTLKIVNKEILSVLNRTFKNQDNYFERVLVKLSLLIKDALLSNAYALSTLYEIHDEMLALCAYFDDEVDKFEGLIEKKNLLDLKKISFIAKYEYEFSCNNRIAYSLYELMEGFDKLTSTLKLLHLSGVMDSRSSFYLLKQRYQKQLNTLLSKIIQIPSSKHHPLSIQEIFAQLDAKETPDINLNALLNALEAPFAPRFSSKILATLKVQLQQHILETNTPCMEV